MGPVCGCDSITYDSECSANAAGASVQHDGRCEEGNACDDSNPCVNSDRYFCRMPDGACVRPEAERRGTCASYGNIACFGLWAPVCGCDERVYSNSCKANGAGINAARDLDGSDEAIVPGASCET